MPHHGRTPKKQSCVGVRTCFEVPLINCTTGSLVVILHKYTVYGIQCGAQNKPTPKISCFIQKGWEFRKLNMGTSIMHKKSFIFMYVNGMGFFVVFTIFR